MCVRLPNQHLLHTAALASQPVEGAMLAGHAWARPPNICRSTRKRVVNIIHHPAIIHISLAKPCSPPVAIIRCY